MAWYDTLEYEIPEQIDRAKSLLNEKHDLVGEQKLLSTRLEKAKAFFDGPDLSQEILNEALDVLRSIVAKLSEVDNRIKQIDVEIVSIYEARATAIAINVNNGKGNEFSIVPFKTGEKNIEVTPDEIWMFKVAKDIFDITHKNIEFLDSEKFKKIYGE